MPVRRLFFAVMLDVVALAVALELASLATFGQAIPASPQGSPWVMVGAMGAGGLFALYLMFRSLSGGIPRPSYGRAFSMVGIMLGVTTTAIVFSRAFWSRGYVLTAAALWLGIGLAHRWVRRRRPWAEVMVLVTAEKSLIDHMLEAEHAQVLSVLDPAGAAPDEPLPPGTSCNLAGYPMRSLVSTYEQHTGRLPIVHLMEGWELTVPLSSRGPYVKTKRLVDTLLVLIASPVVLLLGLVISAAIRIDSRGPVIFKQRRIGLEGKAFTLYKFRTMHDGTGRDARFASPADSRLTGVGKVLRRMRIDELPQLWNVVKGDLSLVGPRPEQGPFVDRFSETIPFYTHRHLVRPGISGWAQVNFGYADSEADTIEKLSYDLYYIKHVSPWLDLEILGRSVWTVMSGFGAR
jgi:lipopolysaccharide/colanic/teichoic acid biosynthesis glycosyltransferase